MLQPLDLLVQNLKAVTYLITLNRSVTGEVSRGDPLQEHPEDMLVVPLPGGNPGCSDPITGPAVPSAPATALTDITAAAAPFAKGSRLPSHATSAHGCPRSRPSTAAGTRALPCCSASAGWNPERHVPGAAAAAGAAGLWRKEKAQVTPPVHAPFTQSKPPKPSSQRTPHPPPPQSHPDPFPPPHRAGGAAAASSCSTASGSSFRFCGEKGAESGR